MAKIIPIFKHGDDTDAKNYRPIAPLFNFNRIFEKIEFKRMESFIEQKNLLTPSQYGFRKAHSTQPAILDIVNAIQTNMDNRLFSCGIFIALKKAFDTVDHKIILRKLDHYGVRGHINVWFSSYLQGHVAALVRSHAIGLLPFRLTKEQTTQTMDPSPKTIELLHYPGQ